MNDDTENKERTINHPLEEVFELEEGTTVVQYEERNTEIVTIEEYDKKDEEIDQQFQEVYDVAMDAFESQRDSAELVDPKYSARNAEVAVQFLNAALNAAKEKSSLKQHKDKIKKAEAGATGANNNGAHIGNQNNIFVDRNDLLKEIMSRSQPKDVTGDN